jgi:beta-ureidopropionase / N-carbamoyl-L-amino-acid hydrolase
MRHLPDLRVNAERLHNAMEKMADIGATPAGGVHRLALSAEDKEARDLLIAWLEDIGLEIIVDDMGNIFGKRPGKNNKLPPVLSGSHLDSAPNGGRFDGALGVLGTLEVLRTIHEKNVETERPIVIVNWTNEEGCRFHPAMAGSGVWSDRLDKKKIHDQRDSQGRIFIDELQKIGYKGTTPAKRFPVHAYFECHNEQGPVLVNGGKVIGVPRGIVGVRWKKVFLKGTANHAGTTPMNARKDALCAAAEMILKVNELPAKMGQDMVATVGEIDNFPNAVNVIPESVHFSIDLRCWNEDLIARAWDQLTTSLEKTARKRGCTFETKESMNLSRSSFNETLCDRLMEISQSLGYPALKMVSGAGHDAAYLAQIAPAAMIFVPSIGGQSHVESENTTWEDCEAGANVLLHGILASAMEK